MKYILLTCLTALLSLSGLQAADPPQMPQPAKEHEWLKKFVGEWETESEIVMEPGQEPMKCKGTESVRSLGGFWVVGEGKGEMMGMKFANVMTIGYDPKAGNYVGTWVDSMTSQLWNYTGKVDAAGKTLTLETEGSCPMDGKHYKFKEMVEFKSDDHRVFTSSRQGEDGKWVTHVTVHARKKK